MAALFPEQAASFPNNPLPPRQAFAQQPAHIDLTGDDDDYGDNAPAHLDFGRAFKRPRTEHLSPQSSTDPFAPSQFAPRPVGSSNPAEMATPGPSFSSVHAPTPSPNHHPVNFTTYRPAFAGPSSHSHFGQRQPTPSAQSPGPSVPAFGMSVPNPRSNVPPPRQVIDLTTSPSPPPQPAQQANNGFSLPPDLPPKTPVCIGQLAVTALILYPVPYLVPHDYNSDNEYAPVRLQYEHNPNKPGSSETIHIRTPSTRAPNGETIPGEGFGVVEQKVATSLGPMLGKGLIRLDAKIRKGRPNLPILPLQMLVYTPKGNIPVVGNFLQQCGLLLDHPAPSFDLRIIANYHYFNPHNPPPGGHASRSVYRDMRWSTPANTGKSVEVQRSQVDELFKSLKDGDELEETEPCSDVATRLYPHQKKALTFLLERERERQGADGIFSSLWQKRVHPMTHRLSWFHIVTQQEAFDEPKEAKGAILADDMGLGKTITCVSLIGATLASSRAFATSSLDPLPSPPSQEPDPLHASHFTGSVWGMPDVGDVSGSSKGKTKGARAQEKLEADYVRACRIKVKSQATLIICPLSTVANWEDQFREHWRGEVTVFGGNGNVCLQQATQPGNQSEEGAKPVRIREGNPLRIYIYHGNARRPDPTFLAEFDVVITTYATLASEFSKQSRSAAVIDEDDDDGSSDGAGMAEVDEMGNPIIKLSKPKKGTKRKKPSAPAAAGTEIPSPLQSVYWFRVVLDEAHSIKETATVGSRASCDLMADRRLCLTGTPVQNKLDDVFALIKFLRLSPFDDKNVWTEYVGSPVKFGQALGIARLQTIMKCITLRRTKETRTLDGQKILSLPPRRDELRYLKFDPQEQEIYDRFFSESKAEFTNLSSKNEIMKNYVGILQKILRLRQICDHFELVQGKEANGPSDQPASYEDIVAAIVREGFNAARANAIFAILRESSTAQCVECGGELCISAEQTECVDSESGAPTGSASRRGRKPKNTSAVSSRGPTRANSPATLRPVLTKCQHLFCIECYRTAICPGWPSAAMDACRSCSVCQTSLSPSDAIEVRYDATIEQKKSQKREKRQKGVCLDKFHPSTKVKALLGDLVQFSQMNPYSSNYDSEVQVIDGQGKQVDDAIIKTVVFSQWTSMLDKIEDALEVAGIRYDRLDGTMKRDERIRAMDALKFDPACEVLLVSLKAGGVGLNLTAAQRVYLMDPYWNPAVENQAVDRIHRLGQTRPVTTVKLIIENSIEARLLEVQRKKTELANMTLGQNFTKADLLARRMEELAQLFDA